MYVEPLAVDAAMIVMALVLLEMLKVAAVAANID
jgi:hypothetical protein